MAIGKCANTQLKLDELKKLSIKALQSEAKEEFGTKLTANNGKKWLYFKVAYMWQERIYGSDSAEGMVARKKLEELEDPEYIAEIKEKEAMYSAVHVSSSPNKTPKQKANKKSSGEPTKKRGTCARLQELYKEGVSKETAIKTLLKEGFTFSNVTVNVQWNKAMKAC